jgi:hypothetical protein
LPGRHPCEVWAATFVALKNGAVKRAAGEAVPEIRPQRGCD